MSDRRAVSIEDYRAIDELLHGNLEHYCAKLVTIKPKSGAPKKFIWNEAQRQLHDILERQRDEKGFVRAIILKGRQMGISTYVGARFYQRVAFNEGMQCYILTHEDKATANLLGMAKRIHTNMPIDYRPSDTSNSAMSLMFGGLESGYSVGTAQGTKGTGRSSTLQLFHWSEVAFSRNAEDHLSGVLEAVPLEFGTEIILESTANGVGGVFYDQWQLAEKGQSDFIAVFLPWFIEPGYRRTVVPDLEFSDEELEYQSIHGIDDEQLTWLHFKNIAQGGRPGVIGNKFKQEYPATSIEAFQASNDNALIDQNDVLRARSTVIDPDSQSYAPLVLGVDVALNDGTGDSTRIISRQGRIAGIHGINIKLQTRKPSVIANEIARLIKQHPDIRMIFIDASGGWGSGVIDLLENWGYGAIVMGVNFGAASPDDKVANNMRSFIWWSMGQWLEDPGGADIPDDDELHRHICACPFKRDHLTRIKMSPKEEIKSEFGFSPDGGDSLALTFAAPVSADPPDDDRPQWLIDHLSGGGGDMNWKTM
jgi:hypothetical protein